MMITTPQGKILETKKTKKQILKLISAYNTVLIRLDYYEIESIERNNNELLMETIRQRNKTNNIKSLFKQFLTL